MGGDDAPLRHDLDPGAADAGGEVAAREPRADRVEGLADAHPALAVDRDRRDPREIEGSRGQRSQGRAVGLAQGADRQSSAADVARRVAAVGPLEAPVALGQALHPRVGREPPTPRAAHLALDPALLVGAPLAGLAA